MIPAWVLEAIEAWMAEGMSGDLRLIARGGVIKHIRREDLILPPESTAASKIPKCPNCAKLMVEFDYGNAYRCEACGIKRTKWQLAKRATDNPGS